MTSGRCRALVTHHLPHNRPRWRRFCRHLEGVFPTLNLEFLAKRRALLTGAAEATGAAAPRAPLIEDTLGWILLAQGEDRALTYVSAANLSAPKNPDIQYHLAVALTRLGRTGDAQARLEMVLGSGATFSDRAEAEKLLQQLKRG